ncbi:hypothetical protein EZ428_15950 [Pedobacter frigiditerrae]|uniref:Uncharacterized protein n=1 Tax=Pedobacter frigiditerrae TaxID=2530452 RepID=A0A4R0MTD7_9SPHI|nr:hypothetical protein [Pedobacter frigiditerrae]TCC89194.1 hypothetical protein EZ428_15950 [Pedobacter frigiditerrae]
MLAIIEVSKFKNLQSHKTLVATLKDKTTLKLFNFIKRQPKTDFSPEQTIRRLVDYMPDFYKTHSQFINCVEFLDNREWELALDSLIELANETEHYFSEDFWLGLADAADKMDLTDEAKYCRKQINRNERDIKLKTPFGWTTIKFDDTHFQHHISEKLKEEWAIERREKGKVQELIAKEGVHLKSHGRSGFLYITDNGRIAEVEFELGMNGLIMYFNSLTNWSLPTKQTLTANEKQKIKIDINNWATKTKNAIEFDD